MENQIPNPVSDPGGYIPGMVDVNKKAQDNIQDAVNKENEKLTNALEEESGDSDLAKKFSVALIKTNLGDIKVKFYGTEAPVTVNNFLKLAKNNFYDGTKFHRVIKGFMIQGGDPLSKDADPKNDGTGGPGYAFKDEINAHKLIKGSLAMANSGPNTNGSQFFIVTAEATPWLDGKHTDFGEVISGIEVVEKIENVKTGANDRPTEEIIIKDISLLEK